jgi:hypothetical protein
MHFFGLTLTLAAAAAAAEVRMRNDAGCTGGYLACNDLGPSVRAPHSLLTPSIYI